MALKIYENANPATSFSTDGEMTNPIRHTFDGRVGGVIEKRYYVRNDSSLVLYSGIITVTAIDNLGRNIVNGDDGYSWKFKAGDSQPLDEEWQTIDEGNAITLSGINDTTTYLPFWVRVEVPANAEVESFDDVKIVLTCNEVLI